VFDYFIKFKLCYKIVSLKDKYFCSNTHINVSMSFAEVYFLHGEFHIKYLKVLLLLALSDAAVAAKI